MNSKEKVIAARNKYVSETISERPFGTTDAIEEYILALEQHSQFLEDYFRRLEHPLRAMGYLSPGTDLGLHPRREESLVKVGDSIVECLSPPVNDDTLFVAKKLAEPLTPSGPGGVEVEGEPEPLFDTTSVEGREEFGSANIEKSRAWHSSSEAQFNHTRHYLISKISEIELALRLEFVDQCERVKKSFPSDAALLGTINAERIRCVSRFASKLRAALM